MRARFVLSFILLLLGWALGQTQTSDTDYVHNSQLNFKQQLNIYQWLYSLKFQKQLSDNLDMIADADFRTTMQSIAANDLWKDNQTATVSLNYQLSEKLSVQPSFHSYVLSDQLSGFGNDVELYSGSAKLVYQPTSRIRIAPEIGSKWQTQVERQDHGFRFGLDAVVEDIDFGGYGNTLTVSGGGDQFPQRRNDDFRLRYKIDRQFEPGTADTLIVVIDRSRKDSFDFDENGMFIRNLLQTNQGIENRLSYALGTDSRLYLRNSFTFSSFEVNHLRDEADELRKDDVSFVSGHTANLSVNKESWTGNFYWSYRFRSREDRRPEDTTPDPFGRHATLGFDTDDVLTGLGFRNSLKLGERDQVGLNASVQKFRYETSNTVNNNDHDQLRWQTTLSHQHRFSRELNVRWRASAFLNHFVYISGQFSSGNNWERTFQLYPEVSYRPGPTFGFKQGFIVRAKYQTFDFDDAATSNRNIVNRQFVLLHESYFHLTSRDRVELEFDMELAEQGRLFFEKWQQTLALSWRNYDIRLSWKHEFTPDFTLKSGAAFYQQKRWDHQSNAEGSFIKNVRDTHTNFGPILEINYSPRPALEFRFFGNVQFVSSSRRSTRHNNYLDLYLNWSF